MALVLLLLAALEVRGIDMGERLLKLQVRGRGGGGSFPGGGGAWVGWNRQSMKWQVQQLS